MIHIDRKLRNKAWAKVAEQGQVLMDRGKWVIMFPEGTRTERGKKGTYKSGATRLAVATGAYVVPIAVTSGRCWPRRSFSFIPGVIDVSIGQPVSAEGREPGELMDEVERWIEAEMHRLDPQAYEQ
jgi:1-acyl-sn-glycerol-3-phosphate acyltransferase